MDLPTFAAVLLVALLGLGLVLRRRGSALVSGASMAAFVALAVLSASAVWLPGPYRAAADRILQGTGVRDRVEDLDRTIPLDQLTELAERPEDFVGRLARERLGIDLGGPPSPPDPVAGVGPDYFERTLYEPIVGLVALVLRAATLAGGLAGMLAALALGYAAAAAGRARDATASLAALEMRVAALESGSVRRAAEEVPPSTR